MTDEQYAQAVLNAPALHLATTAELFDALAVRLQGDAIPEFRRIAAVIRTLRELLECSEDGQAVLATALVSVG